MAFPVVAVAFAAAFLRQRTPNCNSLGYTTALDRQERWIANSLELQQIKPPLVTLC
jgi:hypothetical protein